MSRSLAARASFAQSSASLSHAILSAASTAISASRTHSSASLTNLSTSLSAMDKFPEAPYLGGCNPGELTHLSRCMAVSVCRTFLSNASRSGPGGSALASARICFAHSLTRSWRVVSCLNRRRMTPLPCLNKAGAQLAFSSPIDTQSLAMMIPNGNSANSVPKVQKARSPSSLARMRSAQIGRSRPRRCPAVPES
jgi:hypothetical protein